MESRYRQYEEALSAAKSIFSSLMVRNQTLAALIRNRLKHVSMNSGYNITGINLDCCGIEPCYTPTERGTHLAGVLVTLPEDLAGSTPFSMVVHLVEVNFKRYMGVADPAPGLIGEIIELGQIRGSWKEQQEIAESRLSLLYRTWRDGLGSIIKQFHGNGLTFDEINGTLELRDGPDTYFLPPDAVNPNPEL